MSKSSKVIVTGGAGYVGSVLVPKLLARGHHVKVIDLYMYGEDVLNAVAGNPRMIQVKGDIRDRGMLEKEIPGYDAIIHLACISNDPSYELDPELGRSINYDAFLGLVDVAEKARVKRFIYASSSSVYGVKDNDEVTEDLPLEPLTDYSKYKAKCEDVLRNLGDGAFFWTIVRPSTVCGYSPRLRLDLTVNILTSHAVNKGEITVLGGEQKRPNLHIQDMADLYIFLLDQPAEKIHGKTYNVGYENYRVKEIAEMVRRVVNPALPIKTLPTDDVRSYHVSSGKIKRELGFEARHSIEEAITELAGAFKQGKVPNALTDIRYYNIKTMQAVKLK